MVEVSGMTPDEFFGGYSVFISNMKPEKLESGTLLDNVLKNGILHGKITVVVGNSDAGKYWNLYIKHLINSKLITFIIK